MEDKLKQMIRTITTPKTLGTPISDLPLPSSLSGKDRGKDKSLIGDFKVLGVVIVLIISPGLTPIDGCRTA